MFKALQRARLNFSPYLAPVWEVRNVQARAERHHRRTGARVGAGRGLEESCLRSRQRWAGAAEMIDAKSGNRCVLPPGSWRRSRGGRSSCC